MKKILFPIAIASAMGIAALGTLPGQAQEGDVAKAADELEKKNPEKAGEPIKAGDAKLAESGNPSTPPSHLEALTDVEVKEFADKSLPASVADRFVKLVSRGKELYKLFGDRVKEADVEAAKPGLSDERIRTLASEVTILKRDARRLNDAFHQFFTGSELPGDTKPSVANRIASVADLSAAVEAAEVRLGLRPAPAAPRSGFPGSSSRGGGPRGSGGGFNFPGPPTRVDLLKATMSADDVKAYLQARFPAAAMDRIGKLVMRARELAKLLDEKVAKIDADLADEKLSDEQIEAMAGLARTCRVEKENLNRAFDDITVANLSMQTMSEAVSWLPQLSRAVKRVESSIQSIDFEIPFAKSGIKSSDFEKLYGEAIALKSRFEDSLPEMRDALQSPSFSPEQRKAQEVELKRLEEAIQVLGGAIARYDALRAANEPALSDKYISNAKVMQDVISGHEKRMATGGRQTSSPADPKEAHFKLYQRAESLLEQIDSKLKAIGVKLADPGIAPDELESQAQQANDLRGFSQVLRQAVSGYQNSIQNNPSPDQAMVVDNVVEMQRAIRDAETILGTRVTLSVSNDTPYGEVLRAVEETAGNAVRVEIGSNLSPLANRLIVACENLKNQLEAQKKETDEKLNSPDIPLTQLGRLADLQTQLDSAIAFCTSTQEKIRNGMYKTAKDFSHAVDNLQIHLGNVRSRSPAGGPTMGPMAISPGMPMGGMPTGSSGTPMMPGMPTGAMPGMPGATGMPGMAHASQFHEVDELRLRYKKHLDEKNEKAAGEVKEQIAKELARIFDAQQAAREKQLTAVKEKLKKLEEQQAKRKAARDELIESRTKQIIHELEGTQWTDDAPIEAGEN